MPARCMPDRLHHNGRITTAQQRQFLRQAGPQTFRTKFYLLCNLMTYMEFVDYWTIANRFCTNGEPNMLFYKEVIYRTPFF